MRFKDVFSIIGPAMVGPSSSHTAGAVRIGKAARQLFGAFPDQAEIIFYGSFAATYEGHGTDLAVIAGLLDWQTDDLRIPNSISIAQQSGMQISFRQGKGLFSHPNTVKIKLSSLSNTDAKPLVMIGTSIGGGNIEIVDVNGFSVKMTGNYPALVINHHDWMGVIADITQALKRHEVNIAHMTVDRKGRSGDALTALELDCASLEAQRLVNDLRHIDAIQSIQIIEIA